MDKNYSFRTIATGTKTVAAAGTAEALVAASTTCRMVQIQAHSGNEGNVVVGDSNVVAAAGSERGITLVPGASAFFRVKDLNVLYLDVTQSGEGVGFVYFND